MTVCHIAVLLAITLPSFADDPPKTPAPKELPKKKPVRKPQPPPAWLTKPEDPKSPGRPFFRGIYTTEKEWLPLFKPSGKLTVELKSAAGHVLRLYTGDPKSKPAVPASLEILQGEKRIFCARGHRFVNPTAEDLTGDEMPDIFRVTHASGGKTENYHQFIFEIGRFFRVKTIGPFVNEKVPPQDSKEKDEGK